MISLILEIVSLLLSKRSLGSAGRFIVMIKFTLVNKKAVSAPKRLEMRTALDIYKTIKQLHTLDFQWLLSFFQRLRKFHHTLHELPL